MADQNVEESDEYLALLAERDSVLQDRDAVAAERDSKAADLEAAAAELEEARSSLDSTASELSAAQSSLASVESELSDAQAAADGLEADLADAQAEVDDLTAALAAERAWSDEYRDAQTLMCVEVMVGPPDPFDQAKAEAVCGCTIEEYEANLSVRQMSTLDAAMAVTTEFDPDTGFPVGLEEL